MRFTKASWIDVRAQPTTARVPRENHASARPSGAIHGGGIIAVMRAAGNGADGVR